MPIKVNDTLYYSLAEIAERFVTSDDEELVAVGREAIEAATRVDKRCELRIVVRMLGGADTIRGVVNWWGRAVSGYLNDQEIAIIIAHFKGEILPKIEYPPMRFFTVKQVAERVGRTWDEVAEAMTVLAKGRIIKGKPNWLDWRQPMIAENEISYITEYFESFSIPSNEP